MFERIRGWIWRSAETVEVIGPGTSYANGRGCWAPGAAPAEQPDWTGPTVPDGLITYGQLRQYRTGRADRW